MKNIRRLISAVAVSAVIITGCGAEKQPVRKEQVKIESETEEQHLEKEEEPYRFVNPEGNTLETRINPPEGYTRTDEKIAFHFTNGFLASYSKWKQGYRISVNGNNVSWVKSAKLDDSDETFIKYLHMVFNYAGTASMATECRPVKLKDIRIGDVFLRAGSPGHVLMVVDTAKNKEGKTAFLLAQGFMPA